MPTPADSLRLGIALETAQGTLPGGSTFELFRTTGEGLSFEVTTTISDEISATSRGVTDSILTGATVTGEISFELADFDAFEMALTSMMASDWAEDPILAGAAYPPGIGTDSTIYDSDDMKSFTIEKRFTSTPLDSEAETYLYQLFSGCVADTFNLSITPNEIITGSFGFLGMSMVTPQDEAGVAYNDPGLEPVMTAPLVTGIELLTYTENGSEGSPVAWLEGSCFTGIDITANNNGRGLVCIGTLGNKATSLGRFEVGISGSMYYVGDGPLDALIDQTPYQFRITCEDSEGNSYFFFFPRVKFATATALASGTNTDVMVEFTMQALVGSFGKYTMLVTRDPVDADAEAPITADPATGTGTTTVLIPMGGGPNSDAAYTATLALTASGDTLDGAVGGPVAIAQGDALKPTIMEAIAVAFGEADTDITATVLGNDIQIVAGGTFTSIDTASITIT